jgi:iron complex outermembrane receptor protein
LNISWLAKYVGDQYMSNIEHPDSKLEAYFVNDLQVSYELNTGNLLKSLVISGMLNNFLNAKYVSNGYFFTYDDTWSIPGEVTTITGAGYYPQAEINFLVGVSLRF